MKNIVLVVSLMSFLNVFAHSEKQPKDYSTITDLILNSAFKERYSGNKKTKFRLSQEKTLDGQEFVQVFCKIPEVIRYLQELEPENFRNFDKLNLEKEIISQIVRGPAQSKPMEHNACYELDSGTECLLEIHPNSFSCTCCTKIPKEYYEKKAQEFEASHVQKKTN